MKDIRVQERGTFITRRGLPEQLRKINWEHWHPETPEEIEKKLGELKGPLREFEKKYGYGYEINVSFKPDREAKFKLSDGAGKEKVEIINGKQRGLAKITEAIGLDIQDKRGMSVCLEGNLCIRVFPDDSDSFKHPFLDRGLCWINPNSGRASFHLNVVEEVFTPPGKLSDVIRRVEQRVNEEIAFAFSPHA